MSDASVRAIDGRAVVKVGGSELLSPIVKQATDAATATATNSAAAELAAATALASSRYFQTRAAGEAASDANQMFSTDDGAGNLIYYKRTSGGSSEIGRAVTPAGLAAEDGASRIGFSALGSGAVGRTTQQKLGDVVSASDYATLQGASDRLGFFGGEIEMLNGVTTPLAEPVTITKPVSIVGKGGIYSAITPDADIGASAANITISPSNIDTGFMRLENFFLGDIQDGTRHGGVGIKIDTTSPPGQIMNVGRLLVEGVMVGPGDGVGFWHFNDPVSTYTGGLYTAEFCRNLFHGGMKFDHSGDSLLFTTNTTSGNGIGFEFTGTMDATGNTPSQVVCINHNSTSEEGAFLFHRANFPTIQNANMEQVTPNPGGFLVDFKGDSKPNNSTGVRAPSITNSLLAAFSAVDLSAILRFGSVSGGVCLNNWFLDGGGGATADIVIDAGASDVWVGPNLSVRDDLRVIDNGTGTRGVDKLLALESSWLDPGDGARPAYAWKSIDGEVTISGGAKNGSSVPGAPVAILPIGFRPSAIEFKHCLCLDNGSWTEPAVVAFYPNGEVKIVYCPNTAGNTQRIYFDATFRAAHATTIKVPTPYIL